jgi:hypothetical protein
VAQSWHSIASAHHPATYLSDYILVRMYDNPATYLSDYILVRMYENPATYLSDYILVRMYDNPATYLSDYILVRMYDNPATYLSDYILVRMYDTAPACASAPLGIYQPASSCSRRRRTPPSYTATTAGRTATTVLPRCRWRRFLAEGAASHPTAPW